MGLWETSAAHLGLLLALLQEVIKGLIVIFSLAHRPN